MSQPRKTKRVSDRERPRPWVKCPTCENFWCELHSMHVHDCACASIENWEWSPYRDGHPTSGPKPASEPRRVRAKRPTR